MQVGDGFNWNELLKTLIKNILIGAKIDKITREELSRRRRNRPAEYKMMPKFRHGVTYLHVSNGVSRINLIS